MFARMLTMSNMTLAQNGCPYHLIHASCAVFVLTSLRLLHSLQSLSSSFYVLLNFIIIFHVGRFGAKPLCTKWEEEKRLKEVRSWMTMEMFITRLRSWANEVWDDTTKCARVRAMCELSVSCAPRKRLWKRRHWCTCCTLWAACKLCVFASFHFVVL